MSVGQDPFFGPEFEPVSQGELKARWQQEAAHRADRVHHLVRALAPLAPLLVGQPDALAAWVLNQVTTDGSKGLLFQIDSILDKLMDAEHERLGTVVEQVAIRTADPEATLRALLIEIGYEGD